MSGDKSSDADVRAAIERAAAAIRRDPRDPRGWSALGAAYFSLGQYEDAEQALRRARAIDPADLDSALRYAATLLELGRAREALALARDTAIEHPDSIDAHFIAGNVLASLGEHAEAADAFARATAIAPRDASVVDPRAIALAHYNRALALDELGRWDDAARACEAAVALEPALWPALAQLVFLKRRLCEWRGLDALSSQLREAVRDGHEGITPFSFLAEPATAAEQLRCASTWATSIMARTAGVTVGGA